MKKTDLTSQQAVAKSRKVYSDITSGRSKNVTGELNKAHGKDGK